MRVIARVVVVSCVVLAALAEVSQPADAEGDSGGDLVAEDVVPVATVVTSTTDVPVTCSTFELRFPKNGRYESSGYVYTYIDVRFWRFDPETGDAWVRSMEICRRGDVQVSSSIVWEPVTDPEPEVLVDVLYDRASKDIDPPAPELNPPGPGYINLGMWLAVEDPGRYSVTASASATSWVTVTAQLSETLFDMGNGVVVTCTGAGDPIPVEQMDTVEQSKACGFTYTERPDGSNLTITVTSTWAVSWTSSRGTTGTRPPIVKTSTVDYEVLEIQTVGRSNG